MTNFIHNFATLFLVGFLLAGVQPLSSQSSLEPYCLDTEEFAPDGLILKMTDRYFRICSIWSDSEFGRQHILKINPKVVRNLENDYAASNLRLSGRFSLDAPGTHAARIIHGRISTRTRQFGEATYQWFESEIRGPTDIAGSSDYFYSSELNGGRTDIPDHYVTCAGEGWLESKNSLLQCRVWVWDDGIMASLLFIGGRGRSMEFANYFANFAEEIVKVLDAADVTDEIEELKLFLDVVE